MKKIFVGSSSEALKLARAVQRTLRHSYEVRVWAQGQFRPMEYTLEALLRALSEYDFAIFIFAPQDIIAIRDQKFSAVRDNVIFELGLFIGHIGKDRCFIMKPIDDKDLHLPTDLNGLTIEHYDKWDDEEQSVGAACFAIQNAMDRLVRLEELNKKSRRSPTHKAQGAGEDSDENLLAVVVGDRRETPPQTPGDFFAAAPSSRDLTWLTSLGLPKSTVIWHDKIVSAAENDEDIPDYIKSRDLLIIGAPYCNLMARQVNTSSFFRFSYFEKHSLHAISELEKELHGFDRYSAQLEQVWNNISSVHSKWVENLRGVGFIDPILDSGTVGATARQDHDYATISFCKHPYSKTHSAVLVAGLHLPGTMAAVRQLAEPEFFAGRPCGGIIKITIPDGAWYEKLTRCRTTWLTPVYTPEEMRKSISRDSNLYRNNTLTDADLEGYRETLSNYEHLTLQTFLETFIQPSMHAI